MGFIVCGRTGGTTADRLVRVHGAAAAGARALCVVLFHFRVGTECFSSRDIFMEIRLRAVRANARLHTFVRSTIFLARLSLQRLLVDSIHPPRGQAAHSAEIASSVLISVFTTRTSMSAAHRATSWRHLSGVQGSQREPEIMWSRESPALGFVL